MDFHENSRIRFANLSDRNVLTVNMGKKRNGFNVCKKCGGAEVAEEKEKGRSNISQPYHDSRPVCQHNGTIEKNIYLGYEFLTDMFMMDISYDTSTLVGNSSAEERSILRAAATTLHETLKKAVSLVLDIDHNEINGGWRPRIKSDGNSRLEMFFYDNLSSGAGYSSLIGSILDQVLERARGILAECECSRSCKNCLDNYWNQRNHHLFDRQLGLMLLDYIRDSRLPNDYDVRMQQEYCLPLEKLIYESKGEEVKSSIDFEVIPALRKKPENTKEKMYLNLYDLSDWLPYAFMKYRELISED